MNNYRGYQTYGFATLSDGLTQVFDQRSRQELVRDDVVFAPPINSDARLADAIRELSEKKVPEPT
jgi:hypothetical protein